MDCRTTHSIAAQFVRNTHGFSQGKLFDPISAKKLVELLGIQGLLLDAHTALTPVQLAHLLLQTSRKFCNSADAEIGKEHVDLTGRLRMTSDSAKADAIEWIVRNSQALWKRMLDANNPIPLGHDGYLKVWSLSRPKLDYGFVFVDEAQDTNPAVLSVLCNQENSQMVYVGDLHQQIYEWRGAVNAMRDISTDAEAILSQSFRFGTAIANKASMVLRTLGEETPLRGNENIDSHISDDQSTRAVLARTNATVISEALRALETDRKPHIIGGTKEYRELLSDVSALMNNRPGQRPEFFGFKNWAEVVAFADTDEGEQIRRFVTLVQSNGTGRLWTAVLKSEDKEETADVVISTAHKGKGREWPSVRIAEDFSSCACDGGKIAEAEVRLFYVAITRAQKTLSIDPKLLHAFCTRRESDLKQARDALHGETPTPAQSRISKPFRRTLHDGEDLERTDTPRPEVSKSNRLLDKFPTAAAASAVSTTSKSFLGRLLGK